MAPAFAPVATAYNWTGFYAGAHLGGAWVDDKVTLRGTTGALVDPIGTRWGVDRSGVLGGLQAGYNQQFGAFIVGIGADFAWTNASHTTVANSTAIPGFVVTLRGRNEWFSTITGRVGYAFNNVLFYAKGGIAFTQVKYGGGLSGVGAVAYNNVDDTRTGWTLGIGAEYGFTPNWTAFVEYNYMDFGSKTYTAGSNLAGVFVTNSASTQVNVVKAGVNYRF